MNAFCLVKSITWKFAPPLSSHMGGVYERMIRTVRKVFAFICIIFYCNLMFLILIFDFSLAASMLLYCLHVYTYPWSVFNITLVNSRTVSGEI